MTNTPYPSFVIRHLGLQDFQTVWKEMFAFTCTRDQSTPDQLWFLEHHPVYTQGQNGKPEHVLAPGNIPVVQTDRGGQVTYHGPGQLLVYVLVDLRRRDLGVRDLVSRLEQAVIDMLKHYHITATARCDARGVYVDDAKICSIGLRIKKGSSYHGIALNVGMDLEPFTRINPCGYRQLRMTQISDLGGPGDVGIVRESLRESLIRRLAFIPPHPNPLPPGERGPDLIPSPLEGEG